MKQLTLGTALGNNPDTFRNWVVDAFRQIEQASTEDIEAVVTEFTVASFTETRTLNASTATLSDVANFVATLISDIKKGGQKRAYV